jgi:ferric-dicitrate binding protein FerR (iron transport regulator)
MSEDIYNLLAKHFSGDASEAETVIIQQWMNASEQNKTDYRLMEKLWHQSAEQEEIDFDTDRALYNVTTQLQRQKPAWVITLGKAAAIAAAIVIVLLIWQLVSSNKMRSIVADTAVKEVVLEDGSQVYLRKGATLQYPSHFVKNKRVVKLKGEAFFSVVHNTTQPFIITAGPADVTVVGTSFSVINENDSVQLIVKTGRVKFNAVKDTVNKVFVTAGEKAVFVQNQLRKVLNTDYNFNAWQSKQLIFKNTPLQQVAATLSNYYQVNIKLNSKDSAQIAGTTITVTFNNEPLTKVLMQLSLITSYSFKQEGKGQYSISLM